MPIIKMMAPSDLEEGKIIPAFDGTNMVNVCVPSDVKKGESFNAIVIGSANESTKMSSIKMMAPSDLEEGKIIPAFDGTAMVNVCVPSDVKKGESFNAVVVGSANESTSIPMGGQDDAKAVTAKPVPSTQSYPNTVYGSTTTAQPRGIGTANVVDPVVANPRMSKVALHNPPPCAPPDDTDDESWGDPVPSTQSYPKTMYGSSTTNHVSSTQSYPNTVYGSSTPAHVHPNGSGNVNVVVCTKDAEAEVKSYGLANTSLLTGIIGLFVFGIILGPVAIIYGSIVLCNPVTHGGKGKAIAGLILGIVDIVAWIALIAILASS